MTSHWDDGYWEWRDAIPRQLEVMDASDSQLRDGKLVIRECSQLGICTPEIDIPIERIDRGCVGGNYYLVLTGKWEGDGRYPNEINYRHWDGELLTAWSEISRYSPCPIGKFIEFSLRISF